MTNPTKTRRRFTPLQKQEAIELCLSEDLSCTAVAQRLGIPVSSLAKWVRQARIDRGDFGPLIRGSSPARRGLNWPGCARRTVSSGGKRIFSGWRQRTLQKSNCAYPDSVDRSIGVMP